jgi:hypothetical protein
MPLVKAGCDTFTGWTYVPDDNSVFDTEKAWLATDEGKRHKMVK